MKSNRWFNERFEFLFKEFENVWIVGIHQDYLKRLVKGEDSLNELSTNLFLLNQNIWCDYMKDLKVLEPSIIGRLRKDGYFELLCCFKNNEMVISDIFSPVNWDFSISDSDLRDILIQITELTNEIKIGKEKDK